MSHSGLLFKLKSIGVGGSVLSICTEFLSDRRQSRGRWCCEEWIPIISGVPQGGMLGPLLFILYTSEMSSHYWHCMIQNPNKTKAVVVSRSKTVSPSNGDLVLSGVSIRASRNLDILGVKFESKLTFEDHVRCIVSVSLRELVF